MIHRDAYVHATVPPMEPAADNTLWIWVVRRRLFPVEPGAESRTQLTLFDITRTNEPHAIREVFVHPLEPFKTPREQGLVAMDR